MKGNEKIIEKLNDLLADELTAINQYIVHSEMCAIGCMKSFTRRTKSGPLTK